MFSPGTELEISRTPNPDISPSSLPSPEGFDQVEDLRTPLAKEETWEAELYPGFLSQIIEDEYYIEQVTAGQRSSLVRLEVELNCLRSQP